MLGRRSPAQLEDARLRTRTAHRFARCTADLADYFHILNLVIIYLTRPRVKGMMGLAGVNSELLQGGDAIGNSSLLR
jgi:hypothetical protein